MAGVRENTAAIEAFAEKLRELKGNTSHSFESIARRTGVSRSTLHRYCSGKGVPAEFATVERFARCCRAERADLTELHRLWVLASEPVPLPADAADGSAVRDETGEAGVEREAAGPPAVAASEPTGGGPAPATTDPGGITVPAAAADAAADASDGAGPTGGRETDAGVRLRPRLSALLLVLALLVGAGVAAVALSGGGPDDRAREDEAAGGGAGAAADEERALLRHPCDEPIAMGRHDGCVEELQELLVARGLPMVVDAQFGPETLRRVTAFQVFAGLGVNGVVGDETKLALYESDVAVETPEEDELAELIRELFPGEDADTAVAVAACATKFDPLYVLGNENGTRNWGLFQISDSRLNDLRSTPLEALDWETNIRLAHALWEPEESFEHWSHCFAGIDRVREEMAARASGERDQ
ncbi:helix-turn-helix domain-containing protein [Streptomyces spiramenti]|uniref:Helix-turn-helix domain-containing protein n=1 Tax=Streptomyces spiramenti TaxID=2720606 RepID=A0ABX1AL05_9ACTN|nr:helix-turn-helix domain-containing protein [Streptomyces spiramenti]